MSTKYFALLTNIGAAKLAKATALGMQVEITQMAVGDGNDALPTPDPAQTALAREIRRAPLNVLTVDPLNTSQIIAEQVIPEDVGGWWIREIGLFDKDGDMVAIANCAETYKPQLQEGSGRVQVIRMILIVSSAQAVTLKIDPAVVLATRQYVDSEIIEVKSYVDNKLTEHAQSRNHPDATLTDRGFVQLSSATGSTDETKAATPKAVKAAMDNANKRQLGNENLTALSSLAGQPDKLPYFTNKGTMSLADFAAFMRTMLSKTDAASVLEYLGLKETLNPTKRVSIGNIGTGAFDGSTPCINIGDSDSGFIGSADGVLDIYCNNAKVGYIDGAGLHMLTGIATNGDVVLQSDARRHIIIQNADGSARAYIYKDKDDTGIHINNGVDGSGDFVLGKDSILYVPFAVRAGGSRRLAIQSDNNSALDATFNLWGRPERPTVIELDDGQGWHLYSQRNPDGSILFTVNGDIMANRKLNVGDATFSSDGNINGSLWGGWLNDWIDHNFVRAVRLGPVALSGGLWRDYQLGGGQVVTGFHTDGDWEMQGGDDKVYYRPVQYLINGQWVTAPSV
ncbi:phage tail protein [Salmonella enterica subsp. enterica serovar Braenderup]